MRTQESSRMRKVGNFFLGVIRIIISPIEDSVRLVGMIINTIRDKNYYTYNDIHRLNSTEILVSKSAFLSRALSFAAVILCGLIFFGALAVPIPGVTPVLALTGAAVFKALGITLGYAALARTVGAFFGSLWDRHNLNVFLDKSGGGVARKNPEKKDNLGFDFVVKTTLAFGLAGKVGIDLLAKIRSSNNKSKNKSNENPVSIKSEGDAATKRREELEKRKIERIKKEERAQKNQQIETGQPEGDKTNVSSQEAWDSLRQARHHEPPVSQSTTSTQSVSVTPEDSQSLTSVSEKGNSNITP